LSVGQAMNKRVVAILVELRTHAPFTLFGAVTGIICMLVFRNLAYQSSYRIFYVFHPAHVVLSALVTASMFKLHSKRARFVLVLLVGFFGSIGIATLSDSLIPHGHGDAGFVEEAHIGFIEGWYVVIPAAALGILIAYFRPRTRFPHAGHVLLSTWASSFHMLMAVGGKLSGWMVVGSFLFLFLAVWLPCCISDIVFPLLFVRGPAAACYTRSEKFAESSPNDG